nr:hypothetical protein [Tanacetum cinerariifolium]
IDYGGATQDRKSTTGGCQFLRRRIETTDQETKIIAIVDGKPQTISKSSLRRHLKLNDEEGISSLPDVELFENLSLMGYNILPSQRTVPLFASMIVTQGKGLANLTEPHHTPLPREHQSPHLANSPQHDSPPLSHQTIIPKPIPHDLQASTETLTLRRSTKRAIRIAQSKALSPVADEPASLSRDDRQGEAFPTVSSLDAGQDRENITKTSAMSYESSPRVPSLDADEGNSKIARIHAEEELKLMIEGLDRSNEVIAKHLSEYEQAKADLSVGEKIELISELVKYQDHHAKILKYQAQQSKPLLKKEQREFYMSVLKSHAGWKTKHFRGMTLEQIKEKFIP